MTTPADPRATTEYRVPAISLRAGDLVNTAPGGEDDWQRVTGVWTQDTGASAEAAIAHLLADIGDRYVVVQMSDIPPVDSNVYFDDDTAMAYGGEDDDDRPVTEVAGEPGGVRTYLYTVHELVTIRTT